MKLPLNGLLGGLAGVGLPSMMKMFGSNIDPLKGMPKFQMSPFPGQQQQQTPYSGQLPQTIPDGNYHPMDEQMRGIPMGRSPMDEQAPGRYPQVNIPENFPATNPLLWAFQQFLRSRR